MRTHLPRTRLPQGMATKPRIAIIGKGNVGSALAEGLERAGYGVEAVGKQPERVRESVRGAEVVILAVPYNERANALKEMGDALQNKVLVDVTNALTDDYGFAGSLTRSGAEELQEKARGAKVVKAFNHVFAQNMANGQAAGEALTALVAGDDAQAKQRVLTLAGDLGFEPVDAGPLKNARWLEPLGYLNIQLGYTQKLGTDIGFRLVGVQPTQAAGEASRTGARDVAAHSAAQRSR